MKFTLICQGKDNLGLTDEEITVKFHTDSLTKTLDIFEDFLRGCGFVFKGDLRFVEDENESVG